MTDEAGNLVNREGGEETLKHLFSLSRHSKNFLRSSYD